jgi:hypothetical protein
MLRVGKIYRLKFPGIAARVITPPPGQASPSFPYLIESLFLKSRWYVNAKGEPAYPDAPHLILRPTRRGTSSSAASRKWAERLR